MTMIRKRESERDRDEMSAVQFMVVETRQNVMQSQHNTKYDRCITNIKHKHAHMFNDILTYTNVNAKALSKVDQTQDRKLEK